MPDPIKAPCDVCRRGRQEVHDHWLGTDRVKMIRRSANEFLLELIGPLENAYYCTRCGTVKYWPKGVPE